MLSIQMFLFRDNFVLFNFHQDVYDNFADGYGRYILPVSGFFFGSLVVILLLQIVLLKKRILFNILVASILLLVIYGCQSRSLIGLTVIFFSFFFLLPLYKKRSYFFYLSISSAIAFFLFSFFSPSNNDNESFEIGGRGLPTIDFFADPENYQSQLPETYDRWDQHVDAYDYINQNNTKLLGAGAGVMYRTPTFDYLSNKVAKKDNYLTFSDGGIPFVIAKQGMLGFIVFLIFSIMVIVKCFSQFKSILREGKMEKVIFPLLGLYFIVFFHLLIQCMLVI